MSRKLTPYPHWKNPLPKEGQLARLNEAQCFRVTWRQGEPVASPWAAGWCGAPFSGEKRLGGSAARGVLFEKDRRGYLLVALLMRRCFRGMPQGRPARMSEIPVEPLVPPLVER